MEREHNILIIEDSLLLVEMYIHLFESLGKKTVAKYNGLEARAYLEQNVPDLILLDLNIPFISGEELLDDIQKDHRFANTKIFLISGEGRQSDYLAPKVDLVLSKPVELDLLKRLSSRYLGMPHSAPLA